MNKTALSDSEEYELVDKDRDIRGWSVQDHAGRVLGKVKELLVDTDREAVTHIVVDNGAEYPIWDIDLADRQILLKPSAMNSAEVPLSERETMRLSTVSPLPAKDGNLHLLVIEERLRIGKRQIERGGVRISALVSEHPVQTQVQVREEQVEVLRRPVDRSATPADLAQMRDRTVDVIARAEVPVVIKQPRVVEEVVVTREVQEHEETVRDLVRRRDVDITALKPPVN
jgi:stress response protein YsnF